jgi:predicted DNA-binding ribbon-helix-helix protein
MAEVAARAKVTWARLIRKIYEADPHECFKLELPIDL